MSDLPKNTLVKVKLEIAIPKAATEEQVEQWLRFAIDGGVLPNDNPLGNYEIETFGPYGLNFEPTRYIGRREEFDRVETPGGGSRYSVRYVRERV